MKSIEVTVIRHSFRDANGAIHRRRIEVRQLTVEDGPQVIVTPVDPVTIHYQRSGDL